MPVLIADIGIIFISYFSLGRTGVIASSFFLNENVLLTLTVALIIDFFQIPVYGIFLESTSKHTGFGRKISSWLNGKRILWDKRIAVGGFWAKLARIQPIAVIFVSMIPIRGCGIVSACVLCFMLGFSRGYATMLIMVGS
ncbi:MAG: small multi-drug export protein, partial [Desulfobulbaceae bacterium]|nr:small multi-drug export protein [Desulfobulbaceae bacterium]